MTKYRSRRERRDFLSRKRGEQRFAGPFDDRRQLRHCDFSRHEEDDANWTDSNCPGKARAGIGGSRRCTVTALLQNPPRTVTSPARDLAQAELGDEIQCAPGGNLQFLFDHRARNQRP